MAKKDLSKLNYKQLEDYKRELQAKKDAIHAEMREISALMDAQAVIKATANKVAGMSDAERAALAQMIEASGIESQEAIGDI